MSAHPERRLYEKTTIIYSVRLYNVLILLLCFNRVPIRYIIKIIFFSINRPASPVDVCPPCLSNMFVSTRK